MALAYLLKRGRDPKAPPYVDQRAQCEGLEGLAQLPRIYLLRTRVNKDKKNGRSDVHSEVPALQLDWISASTTRSLRSWRRCLSRKCWSGSQNAALRRQLVSFSAN